MASTTAAEKSWSRNAGRASTKHWERWRATSGPCSRLLLGEAGTGKEYLARTLYLRGPRADHPFVQIDCNLLNQKTWNYLLNHHNSPLCDIGSTLYLQNLDALDPGQWRQLLAFLLDGRTARRNRMIFSATGTGAGAQAFLHDFLNRLSCFPIALAPLRTQPEQVDTAFDLYLNRCAMDTGKQLTGIDPEALALLRQYPWPQNWLQFRRVMERLTTLADGPRVTLANVREALQPELSFAQPDTGTGSPYALDLSKPLAQIDREIALLVLERCGDNQSRAAQSLGISRTTLWRMLKN